MTLATINHDEEAAYGRAAPQNLDAEEALLGAMLLNRDAIAIATQRLQASDFYRPAHGQIFDAIATLYMTHGGDMPDATTVAEELRRNGALDMAGGKQNLLRLQAVTPASTNAAHYAEIVDDLACLRRLITAGNEITQLGYDGAPDVAGTLDQAEGLMFHVAQRRLVDTLSPIGAIIDETLDTLEDRTAGTDTDQIKTGFYDVDDALQGLRRQSLIVLAARPGQGKTSLALGIAANVAINHQKPVLFFSMEMSRTELSQRLLAMDAKVGGARITEGARSGAHWTALQHSAERLSAAPMYLDDNPRSSILDMTTKARRLASREGGLGLIVVDYLQLMGGPSGSKRENRQVEVAELSRGLKVLARELDCPVLALSQLNRSLEYRQDKRPMLADLRESGAIEQDADAVLFIYRDDTYDNDSEAKNIAEVLIAKNRHGPTGKAYLGFNGEFTLFENYTGQVR